MNPVDIIVKKRDGLALSAAEIDYFVTGFASGMIPDYQVAAWAMAIYFQGMTDAETTALTLAMAASGEQLDLHDSVPAGSLIVDKHSSGGVGDKTTLAVAPIVAACGLPVGKMSGRGLSFSGGTIDKLESIDGWRADLTDAQFRQQLSEIGLVIAGQTHELAPADKLLYALRDVTGTVPSLPLIASSIMSKKLAAGADAIVLDVKCGCGAFMETVPDGRALARLMVTIGTRSGRRMTALLTQMEQPLGLAVGNALELREAIDTLHDAGPSDFQELVERVACEMLILGAPESTVLSLTSAREQVRIALQTGRALAKFREFIAAQGGDVAVIEHPERLPQAPVCQTVAALEPGYVQHIDARQIGIAVVELGGGRRKKGDQIDHSVGVVLGAKVGDAVERGDLLCTIHAADESAAQRIHAQVHAAFYLQAEPVAQHPLIYGQESS